MVKVWENPSGCPSPIFPIIYMEIPKVKECRGFIRLENLVGDFDFVGYSLKGDDILIDSTGKMIKLDYQEFVIPFFFVKQFSLDELKQNLMQLLTYLNDPEFIEEILTTLSIEAIVNKIATRFSW